MVHRGEEGGKGNWAGLVGNHRQVDIGGSDQEAVITERHALRVFVAGDAERASGGEVIGLGIFDLRQVERGYAGVTGQVTGAIGGDGSLRAGGLRREGGGGEGEGKGGFGKGAGYGMSFRLLGERGWGRLVPVEGGLGLA